MTTGARIDVHHHILPVHYVDTVGATAITSVSAPGFAPLRRTPALWLNELCRAIRKQFDAPILVLLDYHCKAHCRNVLITEGPTCISPNSYSSR